MKYGDLDQCAAWGKLHSLAPAGKQFDYRARLTAQRVAACSVPMAAGLSYRWAAKAADDGVIRVLTELAEEQELLAKYRAVLDGEVMNTGENRKVLHHLLRGQSGAAVIHDGRDLGAFYRAERERFCAFAEKVRSGEIKSGAGKPITTAVQIGIGGSDLGPRAMYLALDNWAIKNGKKRIEAHFISNVDPDDASAVAGRVRLDETIFVLVSKSGTTQ
ncbi:MAG: glucose-6-phosphate isomerase, partial [Treponema sp.]|nr:glucose-6-phosphate isomerase [Treponema sp.]